MQIYNLIRMSQVSGLDTGSNVCNSLEYVDTVYFKLLYCYPLMCFFKRILFA